VNRSTVKSFGDMLRRWRTQRGLSQMALSLKAETSPRHLSFLETGRARPSATMVKRLCDALELSFREYNVMLSAAGFAPLFSATPLDDAAMKDIQKAIRRLLDNHEPFPALVLDPSWEVVDANRSFDRLMAALDLPDGRPFNLLRHLFAQDKLRPFIENWQVTGSMVLDRARNEYARHGDGRLKDIIDEILTYPNVPDQWHGAPAELPQSPVAAFVMVTDQHRLSWFSTVTTFGTPQDITTEELRIESLFPMDAKTDAFVQNLLS